MDDLKESNMNYAAQVFRQAATSRPALIFQSEVFEEPFEITWEELQAQVVSLSDYLTFVGVEKGDVVAGYMPNIPETITAYLATVAVGGVWLNADPKSKSSDVLAKLEASNPKILIAVDGFHWQKEKHNQLETVSKIAEKITSLEKVILFPYCVPDCDRSLVNKSIFWNETYNGAAQVIDYAQISVADTMLLHFNQGAISERLTPNDLFGDPIEDFALNFDINDGMKVLLYTSADKAAWYQGVNTLLHGASLCLYDGFADEAFIASLESSMETKHSIVQFAEPAEDGLWGKVKGWF